MNEIRVANIAFAAYFVISAEGMSMKITRKFWSMSGRYKRVITSCAFSDSVPTTTRSGDMKSLMAAPSFRNSGFEATSKGTCTPRLSSSAWMAAFTFFAVPTGTVDFVTRMVYLLMC